MERTLLQSRLEVALRLIRKDFGIELTSHEILALNCYINSFTSQEKKSKFSGYIEGIRMFLLDRFDLDQVELGLQNVRTLEHGIIKWVPYGLDWLRDERFKEYCRRNAEFWRDERSLI
ncbi:MAG: hypothetical protein AABW75_00180 [Nanoarchaeota archaeon]